jgi:hypothetical protein
MRPSLRRRNRRRAVSSDRAFRALARAEPEVVAALLAAVLPGLVPARRRLTPEHVDDPHLEAGQALVDADWIARFGRCLLVHTEFQGYRDTTFLSRLFRYHLALVLRYPLRCVRTVAVWLIPPPARQRARQILADGVSVQIDTVVLPEVPAELLLEDPRTACFAAGADAGGWTAAELCARAVAALQGAGASLEQWRVARVGALLQERYKEMVRAMQQARVQEPIIEDFVKWGEDLGYRRGRRQGRVEMAREVLFGVLEARRIRTCAADRQRIATEGSVQRLMGWTRRAATARSMADVLGEE